MKSNKEVKEIHKLSELKGGKTGEFYSCKGKVELYKCRET